MKALPGIVVIITLWMLVATGVAAQEEATWARTVVVQPLGDVEVLAAPAGADPGSRDLCVLGNVNPAAWAYSNFIWGAEGYKYLVYPPAQCDFPSGFQVDAVHMIIQFLAEDLPADFNVYVGLEDAVWNGDCWIPGNEICTSQVYNLQLDTEGVYDLSVPLAGACDCAGMDSHYFVTFYFPDEFPNETVRPNLVTDEYPQGCISYNDWGEGPYDLVNYFGTAGEVCIWAEVSDAICDTPAITELVEYWAPAVFQDITSPYRYDYLTSFDFDGDWNSWNNFESLDGGTPLPACVYYAFVETRVDYFLSYFFFHPYDSSALQKSCDLHENDLEGVTLTVKKDGSQFGSLTALATEAHGQVYYFTTPGSPTVIGGDYLYLSTEPNRLDNGLGCPLAGWPLPYNFVLPDSTLHLYQHPSSDHPRPAVFIEAEGHGVGRLERALVSSGSDFTISGQTYGFDGGDGVLYYWDGSPAGEPLGTGLEEVPYELRSLAEVWAHRHEGGPGAPFCDFDNYVGARGCRLDDLAVTFGGDCLGLGDDCSASPPWSWGPDVPGAVNGDWFLDPAFVTDLHLAYLPEAAEPGFLSYLHHPYLQGDKWIAITSPAGDVTWRRGQLVNIAWDYHNTGQGPDLQDVTIQISRDGGPWQTIASGIPIAAQSYQWTVTGTSNALCALRLRASCDCHFNFYDVPSLTVTLPIYLSWFTAERCPGGAQVRWQTPHAPDQAVFRLWRQDEG